jgi:hypothetical protein
MLNKRTSDVEGSGGSLENVSARYLVCAVCVHYYSAGSEV